MSGATQQMQHNMPDTTQQMEGEAQEQYQEVLLNKKEGNPLGTSQQQTEQSNVSLTSQKQGEGGLSQKGTGHEKGGIYVLRGLSSNDFRCFCL